MNGVASLLELDVKEEEDKDPGFLNLNENFHNHKVRLVNKEEMVY